MSAMLPSAVREARARRTRSIRVVLDDHQRIDIGCRCGWLFSYGRSGWASFRDHLADRLADVR